MDVERHEARRARSERRATRAAIGLCLAVTAIAWAPRLPIRPPPPLPERPDIEVAVQGEVASPGRYRLAWGARVGDLVEAAGGLTARADAGLVDEVAPLVDGARIHVPGRPVEPVDRRVSINAASTSELETLPGIGPTLAARIVADRPFHRIDDLERVRGIGPATMGRLRDRLRP